jgi:hypothetical protein
MTLPAGGSAEVPIEALILKGDEKKTEPAASGSPLLFRKGDRGTVFNTTLIG